MKYLVSLVLAHISVYTVHSVEDVVPSVFKMAHALIGS